MPERKFASIEDRTRNHHVMSPTHFSLSHPGRVKFLDRSKFKAFADDKIDLFQKLKFFLGWVENIVGKGENAGNVFKRPLPQGRKNQGLFEGLILKLSSKENFI